MFLGFINCPLAVGDQQSFAFVFRNSSRWLRQHESAGSSSLATATVFRTGQEGVGRIRRRRRQQWTSRWNAFATVDNFDWSACHVRLRSPDGQNQRTQLRLDSQAVFVKKDFFCEIVL